jgi:hypothetical protein
VSCSDGQCYGPECLVFETSICFQNQIFYCSASSKDTRGRWVSSCAANEYCKLGACLPYSCEPNQGFCEHDWFRPCDDAGRFVSPYTERDCAGESLSCTRFGCGNLGFDVIAADHASPLPTESACGNVYEPGVNVQLLTFSQSVTSTAIAQARWFVYEADESAGPYQLLQSGEVSAPMSTTLSSPALDVTLVSGHFYFLGFSADQPAFSADSNAPTPDRVFFGQIMGGACIDQDIAASQPTLRSVGLVAQEADTIYLK